MRMTEILEQVKRYAAEAHKGQRRKYTDEDYIEHPIRVMQTCRQYLPRLSVLSAALLHDVLEDTSVTKSEMESFLQGIMNANDAAKTLKIVVELTDVYTKHAFPHLNRRSRKNKETDRLSQISADAQTIKYADILDKNYELRIMNYEWRMCINIPTPQSLALGQTQFLIHNSLFII